MSSLELLIQQSVEGEFRQHDGVVMVMVT